MPVAKTYVKDTILCDPYTKNGRKYVKIKHGSSEKEVRWYSEAEYKKMYGDADSSFGDPQTKRTRTYKEVLGFKEGYITIFKGETYGNLDWFREAPQCRYSTLWGWYVSSEEELPANVPEDVEPLRLSADLIFVDDNQIKTETEIKKAVDSVIYTETVGDFVGEVGDKVEAYLTVIAAIPLDGYYGQSMMHKMVDDLGNIYIWTTSSKSLTVGNTYNLAGKIKELKTYKGENENILTRCRVVG